MRRGAWLLVGLVLTAVSLGLGVGIGYRLTGRGERAEGQWPLLIEVQAPGYAAPSVEQTVLTPLEQHLRGLAPVRRVRGLAMDGRCLVRLDLAGEDDPKIARLLVENHLALARNALPPSCTVRLLPQADDAFILITVTPAAGMSLAEVSQLVHKTVWPELANVNGVRQVRVLGSTERRFRITLDPERLKKYKLPAWEVVAAIQDSLPTAHDFKIMGHDVTLKEKETVQHLGDMPIKLGENLFVRDVASMKVADEAREDCGVSLRAGKEPQTRHAVFVLVQLPPGKSGLRARRGVEDALAKLQGNLPDGVHCQGRLLAADTTTVVMRFPDTADAAQRGERAQLVAKAMLELPEVREVCSFVQPGDGEAIFWVTADVSKREDLYKALRARLAQVKGTSSRVGGLYSPFFPWPGDGAQVVVRLHVDNFAGLERTVKPLCQRLRTIPGIVDVDSYPRMRGVVTVDIDRERAGLSGVTTRGITQSLTAHADTIDLPFSRPPWRITVDVPKDRGRAPKQIHDVVETLPIGSMNPLVSLMVRDAAIVRRAPAASGCIPHEDGRPCVIVVANVEGRTLEDARTEIRRITREFEAKWLRIDVD